MKRSTLAKRLGNEFLRYFRIPFINQKGNTIRNKKTGAIHTKYMTGFDDFFKYYNVSVNPHAPHAKELAEYLRIRKGKNNR